MSEEPGQGPYVAARVGFECATYRTQGTGPTIEPPCPAFIFIGTTESYLRQKTCLK